MHIYMKYALAVCFARKYSKEPIHLYYSGTQTLHNIKACANKGEKLCLRVCVFNREGPGHQTMP